ncbi:MAG: hypothetical protein VB021_04955 [Oscillospiraceae bacterium]|nr:hypothetical protein [Oscillospiraceae bacterium]
MARWSAIRHKLESDYLAESLRGHIQYYATSYSRSPDHEGRAAIRLDGKEIISGCYYNNWFKAELFPRDETYENRIHCEFAYMDDTAIQLGVFDQRCFYEAFDIFDNQSIQDSLNSDNAIVRVFAVLDRRVGKRTLIRLGETIDREDTTFKEFFSIRAAAEKCSKPSLAEQQHHADAITEL